MFWGRQNDIGKDRSPVVLHPPSDEVLVKLGLEAETIIPFQEHSVPFAIESEPAFHESYVIDVVQQCEEQ